MIKDKDTTIGYHCPHCGIPISSSVNMFAFSTQGKMIKLRCLCGMSELVINITRDKKFRLSIPCMVCPNAHSYNISSSVLFDRDIFAFSCKFTALNICFVGNSGEVLKALKKNEQELLAAFAEYDDSFDPNLSALSDVFGMYDSLEEDGEYDEDEADPLYELYEEDFLKRLWGEDPERLWSEADEAYNSDNANAIDEMNAYDINEPQIMIKNFEVTAHILSTLSQLLKDKKIYCRCKNFDGRILLLENHVAVKCENCDTERTIKSSHAADIEYITDMNELYLDF